MPRDRWRVTIKEKIKVSWERWPLVSVYTHSYTYTQEQTQAVTLPHQRKPAVLTFTFCRQRITGHFKCEPSPCLNGWLGILWAILSADACADGNHNSSCVYLFMSPLFQLWCSHSSIVQQSLCIWIIHTQPAHSSSSIFNGWLRICSFCWLIEPLNTRATRRW